MATPKTLPEPAAANEAGPEMPPPRDEGAKGREIGGPKGPEPTRYGDWEHQGRCSDF